MVGCCVHPIFRVNCYNSRKPTTKYLGVHRGRGGRYLSYILRKEITRSGTGLRRSLAIERKDLLRVYQRKQERKNVLLNGLVHYGIFV